jgi:hypothetical protein
MAKVTRSNRVGCARKACAGGAGTVAALCANLIPGGLIAFESCLKERAYSSSKAKVE